MVANGENQYIYGLHDPGGEHLLKVNGEARGWVLVTEEIRANPNDQGGRGDFYKRLADQGFGVIVRLNHAYGPDGTIPLSSKYRDFAQRAANFVKNSPGAHIWIVGNEMNFEREQPRAGGGQAEPITPRRYADCYRLVRQAIKGLSGHADDQVVVGAIGPWNAQTPYNADPQGAYPANKIPGAPKEYPYHGYYGDFIIYMRDLLLAIGRENCDAIAIHAYSHGYDPDLVFNNKKMDPPFQDYYFNFRTYRDQMHIIPQAFRDLPVYLTEANGDQDPGGGRWPDVNKGWVKNAYKEINDWNSQGNQQIRCMILYRWSRDDAWHIDGKDQVQQDLREAIAKGYRWRPQERLRRAEPVVTQPTERTSEQLQTTAPAYKTRYINHNTPTSMAAGQTLEVNVVVQNKGSITWASGGNNPVRLAFQWYTLANQYVQFPPELDFRTPLPVDIPPNGTANLTARLRTPAEPGRYHLRWDMLQEGVTWFTAKGDQGLLITPVTVKQQTVTVTPSEPIKVQIRDAVAALPKSDTSAYPTRSPAAIRRIIIHHTATQPDVSLHRIAQYQVNNRGLPGIAYHYCVDADGVIFQTQPQETVTLHGGRDHSADSLGVCLIGNFTEVMPPQPQLKSTAALLALLTTELSIDINRIFGYSELVKTASPGATWPRWKGPLLTRVQEIRAVAETPSEPAPTQPVETTTPAGKPLQHYLLFGYRGPDDWAEWDMLGAMEFIGVFAPTVGFSADQARLAQYVTIVGGPDEVSPSVEQALREAGSQVQRIVGRTEKETRQMLSQMAAEGRRA